METIKYRGLADEKALWNKGEWTDEFDKIQFQDPDTILPCLINRNYFGVLCGYVGVDKSHPLYEKNHDDPCINIEVHGGLTYSDHCQPGDESRAVCHKVGPGEDDDIWWFGFDCGHFRDYSPNLNLKFESKDDYKNMAYVKGELKSLARQLLEVRN